MWTRGNRVNRAAGVLGVCLVGGSAGAWGIGHVGGLISSQTVDELAGLGLTDGDFFVARLEADADGVRAKVVIDGQPRTLLLSPHSNRSASFRVWTVGEDGQRVRAVDPPKVRL